MLQRLLLALVEARDRESGGLERDALIQAVWPDEKILPKAAANRLYFAISELRKAGLGDHLLKRSDGYLLEPALAVRRLDRSEHSNPPGVSR